MKRSVSLDHFGVRSPISCVQEAKSFQNIAFMAYFHEIASQK